MTLTLKQESEAPHYRASLTQTQRLLHQAYQGFNTTADPDLIDSYLYEINALQARYSYLLRQYKALHQQEVTP